MSDASDPRPWYKIIGRPKMVLAGGLLGLLLSLGMLRAMPAPTPKIDAPQLEGSLPGDEIHSSDPDASDWEVKPTQVRPPEPLPSPSPPREQISDKDSPAPSPRLETHAEVRSENAHVSPPPPGLASGGPRAETLLLAARNLEKGKKISGAVEQYSRVIREFPETFESEEAAEAIEALGGKVPESGESVETASDEGTQARAAGERKRTVEIRKRRRAAIAAQQQAALDAAAAASLWDSIIGRSGGGTVNVRGYYRKDGTYVSPHTRSAPRR